VTRYLVNRALFSVLVLLGVTLVSFLLLHMVPGDPARILAGPRASPDAVAALREQLGLTQSLFTQAVTYVQGVFTFDFGESYASGTEVRDLVVPRLAPTGLIAVYAIVVSLLVAIPFGIWSAIRRQQLADHGIRIVSLVLIAMPPFWLALLLILVFSVKLGWLPSSGYGEGFLGHLSSLTLPSVTVGLLITPFILRTLRVGVIETLGSESVEAARARGLSERRVLFKHVLRDSLVSTVTVVGVIAGSLVGGLVVVENVFAIPGLGSLLVNGVVTRDFPVVQALTFIFGVAVLLANFLADVACTLIDPRVRL
jgi:peptide/nickel transport system permease protein